jgi:IclR family transcriptional regulator, acetate operon repressor
MTPDSEQELAASSTEASPVTYSVRAAERTLDILDTLARSPDGLPLSAIARDVSMPRSSVFRYLSVLETRRYVARDSETGNYQLGLAFFSFASPSLRSLGAAARPVLERLRDTFGETINLGVLDGTRVLYIEVIESLRAVRLSARRGDRDFIHSSSLGKAIGGQLNESELRRILELEGMPQLTSKTITDPDVFLGVLEDVRSTGFATDMGESEEGACCIAVAVNGVASSIHAAISLSSPAQRFPTDDVLRIVSELRGAAREIAAALRGTSP